MRFRAGEDVHPKMPGPFIKCPHEGGECNVCWRRRENRARYEARVGYTIVDDLGSGEFDDRIVIWNNSEMRDRIVEFLNGMASGADSPGSGIDLSDGDWSAE